MIFNREPVVILGMLQAVIALAVAFGVRLSPLQVGAINGVVAALLPFFVRKFVTPMASPRTSEHEPGVIIKRPSDMGPTDPPGCANPAA